MARISHESPGGGGRRKRSLRGPMAPRQFPRMPVGPITQVARKNGTSSPVRRSRSDFRVMPVPAQRLAMRANHLLIETQKEMSRIDNRRTVQTAQRIIKSITRSLTKPEPKRVYVPLLRFLHLQHETFTRAYALRENLINEMQSIHRNPDAHPRTRREAEAVARENTQINNHVRFALWEINRWRREIERNRNAVGTPHFSETLFQRHVKQVEDLLHRDG